MKSISLVIFITLFITNAFCFTLGYITHDGINLRSDSRITSQIICKLNKGERVNIIGKRYEWYKVVLPKKCSCYVYKDYLKRKGRKGICTATNVNIRIRPSLDSEIVGRLSKGEEVEILGINKDFYKITPTLKCYGYVHKKFVKLLKSDKKEDQSNVKSSKKDLEKKFVEFIGFFTKEDGFYFLKTPDKIYKIKTFRNLDKFIGKRIKMRGYISENKKFVLKSIKILKDVNN